MEKKRCFKCTQYKELRFFYKHPGTQDGHLNKCVKCTKKDVSENYTKKRKQYAEYERKRFQTCERKKKMSEYQRTRRARHPNKNKARNAVSNAVRDGRLKKQPCEVCGTTNNLNAHHDDYRKTLEVRWLCRKHHLKVHGKIAYDLTTK